MGFRHWCPNRCGKSVVFRDRFGENRRGVYVCTRCKGVFSRLEIKGF
jgi:predicted RNA-binding Zn-ribbon protein involved in translation (DUF1610 family)